MAEELILTDPVQPPTPAATTRYRVSSFTMDMDTIVPSTALPPPPPAVPPPAEPGVVYIKLVDNTAKFSNYQYVGKTATNMIKQLNTSNLTTKSMHKRILEKLAADGLLPGTVTGTPDPPSVLVFADAPEPPEDA